MLANSPPAAPKVSALARTMTAIRPRISDRFLFGAGLKSISLAANGDDLVGSDLPSDPADDDLQRIEPAIGVTLIDMVRQLDAADNHALLLDQVTQYPRFQRREGKRKTVERNRSRRSVTPQ